MEQVEVMALYGYEQPCLPLSYKPKGGTEVEIKDINQADKIHYQIENGKIFILFEVTNFKDEEVILKLDAIELKWYLA